MDDSGQDFADICSKLLKRVRRKAADPVLSGRSSSQTSDAAAADPGEKKKKKKKKRRNEEDDDVGRESEPSQAEAGAERGDVETVVRENALLDHESERDGGPVASGGPVDGGGGGGGRAKDRVLLRMQQFRRVGPHMLVHRDGSDAAPKPPKGTDEPGPSDSDATLALRLQQELDRQAAAARDAEALEDQGLFFCQLCQRDLSHMTPEGREQHLNRSADRFKSQKSRTVHLKRCSTELGVAPAMLLQCLQRQGAEGQQGHAGAGSPPRAAARGSSKRKEPAEPSLLVRKRPRKKAPPLDEDTMVALALGEKELDRQAAATLASVAPGLQGRPGAEAGKGCRRPGGKRRKGVGLLRPPPLLLVQDAETALARLQERVAAVLLRQHAPSPPTPRRSPSGLRPAVGATCFSLWRKSTLEDTTVTSTSKENPGSSGHSPIKADPEMTSDGSATRPNPPSSSQTAPSPSPCCAGRLSVGTQALRDVMELAQEGRTLSQWLRDDAGITSDVRLSGFVPEESEDRATLCLSGFLPPDADPNTTTTTSQPIRGSGRPRGRPESGGCEAVALSRLSSDLSSMVNNPQLSDVQVQVDSGEVYFVHSFMLYARCPLLAQMVHDSGFGVQEEGLPSGQRVLLADCPGEAVLALLRYLYTGRCPAPPASLLPPLLELATRFDMAALQHLCQEETEAGPQEETEAGPQEETEAGLQDDAADAGQPWNNNNNSSSLSPAGQEEPAHGDQDFMQLLRSMWSEEEEEGEEGEHAVPGTSGVTMDRREEEEEEEEGDNGRQNHRLTYGDGEPAEEHVNDEELEEIYEFAATQRKLVEERDSTEQEEEQQQEEDEEATSAEDVVIKAGGAEHEETLVGVKADSPPERSSGCPAPCSPDYSRLFSGSWGVCEEFPASPRPSTSCGPKASQTTTPPCRRSPNRASRSDRTCLQSPPSEIIDLSASSPCPTTAPSRPLPGLSPGKDEGTVDRDTSRHGRPGNPLATDTRVSPKRESHGPRGICQPTSPEPPRGRQEPELIVLSDSSEEEAVPAASPGPSPPGPSPPLSPVWTQSHQQYTGIKPHPVPSTSPTARRSGEGGCDGGPGSVCDAVGQSPDQMGFSPEVSWLVPGTPLQASPRSTRTSSISTQSSMCRTQLFPSRASASSPPPAAPSSSPCRSKGMAQASGGHEGSVTTSSIGPEFSFDARRTMPVTISLPAQQHTQPRPPGFTHLPRSSSERSTPAHARPRPYSSSTPLHTDPPEPPVPLETSLLPGDPERQELGRTRLSQSDPSDGVSPASQKSNDRSGSTGDTDASCRRALGSDHCHGDTVDLPTADPEKIRDAHGSEVVVEGEESGAGPAGDHGHVTEASLCQSFTDEPPMAFSDSWCQAPCFSLRLENSDPYRDSPVSSRSPHPPCMPIHDPDGGQNPSAGKSPGILPAPHPLAEAGTPTRGSPPEVNSSLQDPQLWDSWEEEEEESRDLALPLMQRVNPAARFQTPVSSKSRKRANLVPITPMPSYSDMDTPDLKNKLNRFGVRPLPKRQMILKLREIHQYTHQLVHSDEEEEEAPLSGPGQQTKPPATTSSARPLSYAQQGPNFKQPRAPTGSSPGKRGREEEDAAPLSSSQGSNTSSTAASEESNPELLHSSDSESDGEGGVTASQVACRHRDRVQAVRAFILSDPELYNQVLRYQPLVLCQLQARLKAAGIRLAAAKLLDYLDSQCITVTTAKPGQSAAGQRRGKAKGARAARAAGERGAARGRKKKTALASE
ncbi:LOW QUALITY PROTEIN: hypothetical protein CRUP_019860 [Coryphaenoides rupestris]|nr:LOW QUALITY PROTEIN: hypothetical protein CRUP_019860 [Coryphaenoides rupestris]